MTVRKIGRHGLWQRLALVGSLVALALAIVPLARYTTPASSAPHAMLPADAARQQIIAAFGQLPLHFEANHDQVEPAVDFLARGPGYSLFLTPEEAVLSLRAPEEGGQGSVVRWELVGSNPQAAPAGLEELPGRVNYFLRNDPARWRTDIPTYARVQYRDVYPGIDLVYYGNGRQLEYDFGVAPGADPSAIALRFEGADSLAVDAAGDLRLELAGKTIQQRKPVIYQEIAGRRHKVTGECVRTGEQQVGFAVGASGGSRPLVIDPVVLVYSTYLGSSGADLGVGIAVDSAGNAYVTGIAGSPSFPTTPGSLDTSYNGDLEDAFVTKLNATGSALVYSTFIGGSGEDRGTSISLDTAANAYITGATTSTDFPTT